MAYRKTEKVQEALADKRQRILSAARRLVSDGGFQEAPVTAVAGLAGVATGTVYRHFASKAALFAEMIGETSQRELEVVEAIALSDGPASLRLADAVRTFARRALRRRRLAYALVAEPVDAETDATRLRYRRALARVFETVVEQGMRSGEFPRQNAAASAACLVGTCIEGLVGPLSPDGLGPDGNGDELVDDLVAFCLRAVGAPAERAATHAPRART
ncbi:transcriptional regulator, TetR family [Tistlia consotensis]|uniref:Transcriptional regulator, TetR family n=1 Tax=Tistlia consotensis USBA 355 TaxID=560819 RepID=A0A1Y6BJY0_9PROT|nr:TetR/AcrR family transcriptional regulator [Tistlia consotensis]SMF13498.1 transcriptional regulator, TetR family [Tistlia consotensis USBA 355]SNR50443.1 transcriptional regulator, TetR family [Tistlia consotensis]